MEYIFGKNTVVSYLDGKDIIDVFILDNFKDEKILSLLNKRGKRPIIKDKKFFKNVVGDVNHQGIIASIKEFNYAKLDDIISNKENSLIVMLDGIEDPHNLGAIIRTLEAFSVDGLIIGKHDSCKVNATVAKVSTGALANVSICEVVNLKQTINELKEKGYWVYAAEAYNSTEYQKLDYHGKVLLIVGSEGFGISRLVKESADFNIKIPMTGKVNSLNVSCATAILVSFISIMQKS